MRMHSHEHIRYPLPSSAAIADPKAKLDAFIQSKIENSHLYPPLDMPVIAFHNLGQYRFEETTAFGERISSEFITPWRWATLMAMAIWTW
jgi:hypothetical protein